MTEDLDEAPARMQIVHLKSQNSLSAQFNPSTVSEQLGTVWARMKVLGQTFEELQYIQTKNLVITMAMQFDAKSVARVPAFGGSGSESAAGMAGALPEVVRTGPGIGNNQFLEGRATREIVSIPGRIKIARKLLLAFQYPSRGAQEVRDGAPSRLLFVWPNMWSITCRLIDLKMGHTRFSKDLSTARFSANLKLEVDSMGERLTFEDVLADGTIRNDSSAQG